VQDQFFSGERDQRVGARISTRGGAEHRRYQRSKRARISGRRPRNQILHVFALRRGKNGKEQRGRRLASVARCRDYAQRATADPTAAPFISERWTPTTAAHYLAGRTPAVRD